MTTKKPRLAPAPAAVAPPVDVDSADHRAALSDALDLHAEDIAGTDAERARLAKRAADAARRGDVLPYIVGSWGGRPNFQCRWCPDAHLSERTAAIHGQGCKYRTQRTAAPRRTVGGIS